VRVLFGLGQIITFFARKSSDPRWHKSQELLRVTGASSDWLEETVFKGPNTLKWQQSYFLFVIWHCITFKVQNLYQILFVLKNQVSLITIWKVRQRNRDFIEFITSKYLKTRSFLYFEGFSIQNDGFERYWNSLLCHRCRDSQKNFHLPGIQPSITSLFFGYPARFLLSQLSLLERLYLIKSL